jgi:hypothetical protein
MRPEVILPHEPILQAYEFIHEGVRVQKESFYFLAVVEDQHFTIQEREVMEAGWFVIDDAIERLTHTQAKQMLREVSVFLRKD